ESTQLKRVSESFLFKVQSNNTLPNYLQLDNTICSNCYNSITINSLFEFK
ncbi:3771_t:CDS:1, partial [Scutellospora calospora]